MMKATTLASVAVIALAGAANAVTINEAVMNDDLTDDREYVELCGNGESLDGLTLVVIEGEGTTAKGIIDVAIPLSGPISGYYVIGDAAVSPDLLQAPAWIENGGLTILLVSGFSSAVGTDIDVNNDGVADVSIGTIVDGVGVAIPSAGDATYFGVPTLGPDTGNTGTANFDVAGVVRCTDCDGAWGMICLSGTEPAGAACDTGNTFNPYFVEYASPGAPNLCPPVSVESETWGKTKASYR